MLLLLEMMSLPWAVKVEEEVEWEVGEGLAATDDLLSLSKL